MAAAFDKAAAAFKAFASSFTLPSDRVIIDTDDDERIPVTNDKRHFATYLELTTTLKEGQPEDQAWQTRTQWIAMPRYPGHTVNIVYSRYQHSMKHKPTWQSYHYSNLNTLKDAVASSVAAVGQAYEPTLRPPIVVELTLDELRDYVYDINKTKTPWKVLQRATRVAKKHHGFTI
jgi:hypothetical protein